VLSSSPGLRANLKSPKKGYNYVFFLEYFMPVSKYDRVEIKYVSGWMGGQFLRLDTNQPLDFSKIPPHLTLVLKRVLVDADLSKKEGEDYDHGHLYAWSSPDFTLKFNTPVGVVRQSLRDWMSENRRDTFKILLPKEPK
jgi:hypothetical protein